MVRKLRRISLQKSGELEVRKPNIWIKHKVIVTGKINQVMQRVSQLCRNKARQPRAKLNQGYFSEKGKADAYIRTKKTPTGFNKRGLVTRKDRESITMSPHEGTRWRTFLAARIALRDLSRGNPFGHHQGLRAWSDVASICGLQSSG
jgi:hypothetical protein